MLSDKLYQLRKKSGLSQEQLAEALNVSRQSVSKWESGLSMPESEKLIAISEYFGVTLDYLMKDGEEASPEKESGEKPEAKARWVSGLLICVAGAVGLIVWGLISIFQPSASNQIGASSAIHIDGNGIFLVLCVAAILIGAGLLLKNKK